MTTPHVQVIQIHSSSAPPSSCPPLWEEGCEGVEEAGQVGGGLNAE